MKKLNTILGLSFIVFGLAACQSTPSQYNGTTGYQIENKTANSATIAYTLSGRANRDLDINKLQRACQKAMNTQQKYKLEVLSINEIANPNLATDDQQAIQLGHSRASFGLSNTQSYNSTEDMATRQALETRPSTLHVVRYNCS